MRRSCGKRRYSSEAQAVRAIAQRGLYGEHVPPLRVYECPLCHGFHLTKQPYRPKRKRRRRRAV